MVFFKKINYSLKNINYKMFFALFLLGLVPTIYNTFRIYLLGQLPNEWSFSIAAQLAWVNLIFEVASEAIILPLFYFIGQVITNKYELNNRVKTGIIVSGSLYTVLAIFVSIFAKELLHLMEANDEIIDESATYIRIEVFANIFIMLVNFILVVLVSLKKPIYLYIFTFTKFIIFLILDTFLVSNLDVSANLGVNGIAITNLFVNFGMFFIILIIIAKREQINVFTREKLSFAWFRSFLKIGGISGLESLVRNLAYMIVISRMVNSVNEQGNYWIANSFIWSWLLLPIIQLGELIKSDCSIGKKNIENNMLGYFSLTFIFCLIWLISIPLWKPFLSQVLDLQNYEDIYNLLIILLGFYILFAFQNVFDATFYGLGKTNYMLLQAVVVNSIYYITAYFLFVNDIFVPTLKSIALLFGIGIAMDSIISFLSFIYLIKKYKYNILNVDFKKQRKRI